MTIPVIDRQQFPAVVRDGDGWRERYDALREAHPYFRVEGDPAVWFTRYDACREILVNGELFWEGGWGQAARQDRAGGWELDPAWDETSAEEGVRRHIALRQALMPKFGPAEATAWEGRMRAVSNELIDRFEAKGEADFVSAFSKAYFPYIGAELLGAPREDWDMLTHWEHEVFKAPSDTTSPMLDLGNETMQNIVGYVAKLMDEKRKRPDDRFISYVVQAEADGLISPTEARWAGTIAVLGSGHTVTAHLGYVFNHLATRPELQAKVCAQPDSVNAMCEELLRYYSMFGHTRTVTADAEFHGCQLKKGDTVFICYTIPNRDPRVPGFDHLDLDRPVNRHLAFNQGWRQCIGMHFARRARNIAVQEWHRRIPRYALKPGARLVEQVYAGMGFHELPLLWGSKLPA
jgi:cytochrome P450